MTEEAPPPKKIEAINYRVKGRFEAVLSQIISVGPPAYLTHKAAARASRRKVPEEQLQKRAANVAAIEEKVSANDASISALKQRLAAAKLTASARATAAAQVCAWHPCMPGSSGPHVT